ADQPRQSGQEELDGARRLRRRTRAKSMRELQQRVGVADIERRGECVEIGLPRHGGVERFQASGYGEQEWMSIAAAALREGGQRPDSVRAGALEVIERPCLS